MSAELMTRVDLAEANARLAGASPSEILRWGVETFYPRLTMATAFGPEGCVILHMLAEIEPRVRVFNLDTGYQFAETLQLRDRIAERYGIEVEMIRPDTTVEEYERQHGGPLYGTQPDQCCHDRKIVPLRRAVAGYDAWISSIRADQSAHRARADVVGWDAKFGLVKINPLLRLDAPRRLGVRGHEQGPVQPPARPGLSVDRVLALHAGRRGPATTNAPAAGRARRRPNAGCIRSTAASSRMSPPHREAGPSRRSRSTDP